MAAKPPVGAQIGIEIDPETLDEFDHTAAHDLFNMDCVKFLNKFDFEKAGRVVIYADPPYVTATRLSNARYRHDYTDGDHIRLIECLRRVPASVILSGYPSAL